MRVLMETRRPTQGMGLSGSVRESKQAHRPLARAQRRTAVVRTSATQWRDQGVPAARRPGGAMPVNAANSLAPAEELRSNGSSTASSERARTAVLMVGPSHTATPYFGAHAMRMRGGRHPAKTDPAASLIAGAG